MLKHRPRSPPRTTSESAETPVVLSPALLKKRDKQLDPATPPNKEPLTRSPVSPSDAPAAQDSDVPDKVACPAVSLLTLLLCGGSVPPAAATWLICLANACGCCYSYLPSKFPYLGFTYCQAFVVMSFPLLTARPPFPVQSGTVQIIRPPCVDQW